ncbi:hypothetical protein OG897_24040 [Streptomyces sp. NBC_00237]|uniref:hypothetical protein n=1 Tax=Streptomyces sp. NBC_00237 TaxID=2975687 RepID=UPI002251CFE5|nr:hypothetical protein [Streptomyces sp. NBC_00237]MCX5204514.1 hypothetical protein [Streptomyces sp. NBC_00237]
MSIQHSPAPERGAQEEQEETVRLALGAWFPGRFIGGAALALAPVAWCVGLLLRYLALRTAGFTPERLAWFDSRPFPAYGQLAVSEASPGLATAGYGCFAAGAVLLCVAFVALAGIVAVRAPRLARIGGTLVVIGLFCRLYWAGVDHTAFQLIESLGLDRATQLVMAHYTDISYGPLRVPITAAFALYAGTAVLAVGAFRSGTFGTGRLVLFLLAGSLWTGALKESGLLDVVLSVGLCAVFVPLGIRVLRGTVPELRGQGVPATGRGPLRILSW